MVLSCLFDDLGARCEHRLPYRQAESPWLETGPEIAHCDGTVPRPAQVTDTNERGPSGRSAR